VGFGAVGVRIAVLGYNIAYLVVGIALAVRTGYRKQPVKKVIAEGLRL
jgi:hypothetical protein